MKQPPNSAYWKKRFKAIENQANLTGANNLAYIVEQYLQAMKELETQISVWYTRFAKNNGITLHEAKKQLSGAALKEFQWTVQEYIQYGKENALNGAWMKQLENASAKWHITRLDALKLQNQAAIEALFGKQEQSLTRALMKIYPTSYYHTCYEVQKAFEIGWDIVSVNEKKLAAALSTPWTLDGSTFSDRLWSNKQKLIQNTQSTLAQGIMLDKTPDKLIAELQKKMKTSQSNAGRLVMTETAAISAMGQKDAFHELNVEEFEIVETLDNMTCEVCTNLDGQHFPMSEYEIGVTAPQFHPWCRGCTCPYFHDEFTADSERIARGEDGKQYYVLGDTTYQEWKQAFVDGDKSDYKKSLETLQDGEKSDTIIKIEPPKEPEIPSKAPTLTNAAGVPIIIVEHVDPRHGPPNGITQKIGKKGGIDRNFYNEQGLQILQISNNGHGHKIEEKMGKHGEHAHDYVIDKNGIPKHLSARELSDKERKDNSDFL